MNFFSLKDLSRLQSLCENNIGIKYLFNRLLFHYYEIKKKNPKLYSRSNAALIEAAILVSKERIDPYIDYFKDVITKTGTEEQKLLNKLMEK